jgi:hypothetical protein
MYDPSTGLFNRLDDFFGDTNAPQSFNKYLYTHGDPVQGTDPTGEFLAVTVATGSFNSHLAHAQQASASTSVLFRVASFASTVFRYVGGFLETMYYFSYGNSKWEESVRKEVHGAGGSDITSTLIRTTDGIARYWRELMSDSESDRLTTFTFASVLSQSSMYSLSGWDAAPLNGDEHEQRLSFAQSADWAPRSVTVDQNVYYAHEVNYFLWGAAHALAGEKTTSHALELTKEAMIEWVFRYRESGADAAYLPRANDGSKQGRAAWAAAGWDYIKTGVFAPPLEFKLPNATSHEDRPYSEPYINARFGNVFPVDMANRALLGI